MAKPIIRTVHHLSCSGGSVISKCIAAMPDVFLLSELHPDYCDELFFNPYDPVQQLLAQTELKFNRKLRRQIFLDRVSMTYQVLLKRNKIMVIRDHTHSDYLKLRSADDIQDTTSLIDVLSEQYNVLSVLTVRNPLDSYISLCKNRWNDAVQSFDDYCTRVLLMLNAYSRKNCSIYRYEDFCQDPDYVMKKICLDLDLTFFDGYKSVFFRIPMTGDSGRGRDFQHITPLQPRTRTKELMSEAERSASFTEIAERLGYEAGA